MSGESNETLAAYLNALGWSPRKLAHAINRFAGAGTVTATAPYSWVQQGRIPRSPLPTMVAHVLSLELGRHVTAEHVWQGRVTVPAGPSPAIAGLSGPWALPTLARILEDWVLGGLADRRRFLSVSGPCLLGALRPMLDGSTPRGTYSPRLEASGGENPLVGHVEAQLPLLQRLDDEHGGASHLAYVGAQFRAVALLIHEGGHTEAVSIRLLRVLAEIGQLAGWMAFDAAEHATAQRYFLTSLRAAHQVNDMALGGHILADLCFQSASCGRPGDAVRLGEAASDASRAATPAARSSVLSRLAYAYAVAGREADFSRTRVMARELIERSGAQEPRWMYYLTASHLDCQAGYALVQLGRKLRADGRPAKAAKLLSDGTAALGNGAHGIGHTAPSQRRALFEGAWLALGYSVGGELEQACRIGRTATSRLDTVRSPRSVAVLDQLAGELRRRQGNAHVRDFLPELERMLSRRRVPAARLGEG